jgi:predicted alpha/beta superfamily hydrolase
LKKVIVTILFAFVSIHLFAQKDSIIFILVDNSGGEDSYYFAGNINGWNPADSNYKFKRDADGTLFLMALFDKGATLEFKFTRGGWDKVECSSNGADVANRKLKTDTAQQTVYYVNGWKDKFAKTLLKHTASANVSVLDSSFFIPQLNRNRRIWVYLPADYNSSKKHYPVLYMHDGQNLFDNATAAFGEEWGVDETIDSLTAAGKPACIVVGIDNGSNTRMSEYNPYEFTMNNDAASKTFAAEGNEYAAFITETLKPFIDKKFRTFSSKENTMIAGSSMGGLISYYAALKYPQVFGKAGIFSPAFWTAPAINNYTDSAAAKVSGKFFFYAGSKESNAMVKDMYATAERLGTNSTTMIYTVVDAEGKHNETYWRKWFAEFYNWMMADGYNIIIKTE